MGMIPPLSQVAEPDTTTVYGSHEEQEGMYLKMAGNLLSHVLICYINASSVLLCASAGDEKMRQI